MPVPYIVGGVLPRVIPLALAFALAFFLAASLAPAAVAVSSISGPVHLSAGDEPRMAIDAQGGAVVVWTHGYQAPTPGCCDSYFSDVQGTAGAFLTDTWLPPVGMSPAGQSHFEGVASDPGGDAVAVWDEVSSSRYRLETAFRAAASGTWQAPATLSSSVFGAAHGGVASAPRSKKEPSTFSATQDGHT
jgi:hypothetical protein